MRIISGTHKGRMIHPPGNIPIRPTTDFAKEGLFNILNNRIFFEDLVVLDLFTGTGSITFEFASRGAKEITVVDNNHRCVEFIRITSKDMGFSNIKVIESNVFIFLSFCKGRYDLIFADPPYDMKEISTIPDLIFDHELLNKDGLFILEHSRDENFLQHHAFSEHRNYGKINFSFFKLPEQ